MHVNLEELLSANGPGRPRRAAPSGRTRLTDTPAAQYAAWGKAPEQYPHAERW